MNDRKHCRPRSPGCRTQSPPSQRPRLLDCTFAAFACPTAAAVTPPPPPTPEPSAEQRRIVDLLCARTHHLVVNSIAGAGKTTTIVFAVQRMLALAAAAARPPPTVQLITYNAALKLETRERLAALGLDECARAHSYHSHAVRHLAPHCFDDRGMTAALNAGGGLRNLPPGGVDVLFIDEAQDQTELYFRYVCAVLRDLELVGADAPGGTCGGGGGQHPTLLCLLGDSRQCIFAFNGADARFLELAPQLYPRCGPRPWAALTLTTSYRLTRPLARFVNHVMLRLPMMNDEPAATTATSAATAAYCAPPPPALRAAMGVRIESDRTHVDEPGPVWGHDNHDRRQQRQAPRPVYLICDSFGEAVFRELERFLQRYDPGDVFVLAPSVSAENSPVRRLENAVKRRLPHVPVFVTSGGEERLDREVLAGKLVFATLHQTKGLGRPVVIVLGFDEGYFRFFARDMDPALCPNPLYVAATRSSAHLLLVQHHTHEPLPFLDAALLPRLAEVRDLAPRRRAAPPRAAAPVGPLAPLPASKLTDHLPPAALEAARARLEVRCLRPPARAPLELATKSRQPRGVENVAAITGVAVPAFFELRRTGHMAVLDQLREAEFERMVAEAMRQQQQQQQQSARMPALVGGSFGGGGGGGFGGGGGGCAFGGLDREDGGDSSSSDDKSDDGRRPGGSKDEDEDDEECVATHAPLADWEKPHHLDRLSSSTAPTPAELLYIACCHLAMQSRFLHKVYQIKRYDWLSRAQLEQCAARLESLGIGPRARFEVELPETVGGGHRPELFGRTIVGVADCLDDGGGTLYEFKCSGAALSTEHVLQLAVYMYMHNAAREHALIAWTGAAAAAVPPPVRGLLYNVLSDEMLEVRNDPAALTAAVRELCEAKFGARTRTTDAQFLARAAHARASVGFA